MKILKVILWGLSLLLVLTSCSDFTSPDRFDGDTYSISGLLVAGSSINLEWPVYVCRSSSINDFSFLELFVADATVKIYDETPGAEIPVIELFPVLDLDLGATNPMPKIKYIDLEETIIQANHTYKIEVDIPNYDKQIWARTTVPQMAILNPDYFGFDDEEYGYSTNPEQMKKMRYSDVDIKYPLALDMGDFEGSQYFMSELFCLEEFSTDLEFTTPVFGFTNPDETMRDGYYQSGESIRRIQIMGKYASLPQPDAESNYIMIRDYKQAFVFYGRYRVTAFVVDKNYYEYSFMPEGYLSGGVKNGLGYFGSASGGYLYTEIVKN